MLEVMKKYYIFETIPLLETILGRKYKLSENN